MAVIHKGKNDLAKKRTTFLLLSIIFVIPTIAYFYAFVVHRFHFDGLLHLTAIVPAIIGGYLYNRSKIYQSGLRGEKLSLKVLSKLPKGYHVFTSLPLKVDGKIGEVDTLVVGPNGIFVVETKGMNGLIEGSADDHKWIQHKVGRKGGKYSKQIKNPIKQVNRQVWMTSTLLRKEGISYWIQGCVYFSNPDCKVNVSSPKVPVFERGNDLSQFILKYKSKERIDVERVVKSMETIKSRISNAA